MLELKPLQPTDQGLDSEIGVLHIDDEDEQLQFTKQILESLDHCIKVESMSRSEDALERVMHGRHDCVITDYQMPVIDGIELARRIKSLWGIPLIIYTGRGSDEVARKAFEAKADDYVQKQIEPAHYLVLARRIHHAVERSRMKELYGTVVNGSRDAVVIVDGSQILYANQAMADLVLSDDAIQLKGLDLLRWVEKSDRLGIRNAIRDETGAGPRFHRFTLVDNGGRLRPAEAQCNPIMYGGKKANLCFIRGLSENDELLKLPHA
jgi:CheY-like chemotaxis protein